VGDTGRDRARRPQRRTEAATTKTLPGPPGSEIGTRGYDQPDQGDGARLWNLYRGHPELIDHIFVSHLVTHHVTDGQVTAGAPAAPPPASIDDNPNTRANAPASDHRPLVATIDL
jgi:hypothetical protein